MLRQIELVPILHVSRTLLIHGVTGTLGFAAVAIALGLGASKIIGIGRNKERLQQVADLSPVAGRVITVSSEEEDDLPAFVKKHTGGLGVDVMYDCLGVVSCFQLSLHALYAEQSNQRHREATPTQPKNSSTDVSSVEASLSWRLAAQTVKSLGLTWSG